MADYTTPFNGTERIVGMQSGQRVDFSAADLAAYFGAAGVTAPDPAARAAVALPTLYTAVGNSIASGTTEATKVGWTSYIPCIEPGLQMIRREAANWAFANPGYTIQQMINADFHTSAAASAAHVVIFGNLCANDFPTASNYLVIYNKILILLAPSVAARKRIVIIADTPRGNGTTQGNAENRQYQAQINLMLSKLCADNGYAFVDAHTAAVERATGNYDATCTPDYVHPSEAYHWYIASLVAAAIKPPTSTRRLLMPTGGVLTTNPLLQNPTNNLASGWTLNAATGFTRDNPGPLIRGQSQGITSTGANSQIYRTDGGVQAGKLLRASAVVEVLAGQPVQSIGLYMKLYMSGSRQQDASFGSGNSSLAAATPRFSMAPGIYWLPVEMMTEDAGSSQLTVAFQGDSLVVHHAAQYHPA
ncbi:SGNH/GDSL hydrolase family protein [Sphingomonas sp.]|uniref:SGNH/GDSL hydrolase family protein n=1 Tax=Sphingomonas sp. TaxID=28214 RepID=UPI0035C87A88